MKSTRNVALWLVLLAAVIIPHAAAALSPQLAWRGPIYIAAGFAGVFGMALLLIQPLLAGKYLPGLSLLRARQVHRIVGCLLLLAVIGHVIGLWITSPPDMIDALLLRSPTPFSLWGVLAMWAIFGAAIVAIFQHRIGVGYSRWRLVHFVLALFGAVSSVVHALQIEGTMETFSKAILCVLVLCASGKLGYDLGIWKLRKK